MTAALLAAGCVSSDQAAPPPTVVPLETAVPERAVPTSPTSASTPTTAEIGPETPEPPPLDLSQRPFVVFAPIGPQPAGADLPLPDGSLDYIDLFDANASWLDAAARVDLFKLSSWQVRHYLTDTDLALLIESLDQRQIPLGLEMEPLEVPDPAECDQTESFAGIYDLQMAQRIKDFGGTVAVAALDEPYAHAHKLDGPGSCQYSVERVVDEVADFVSRLRDIFPDVVVGSIEPVWSVPRIEASDMEIWLDTYEARTGERFAFLDMDVDWRRSDWVDVTREIEEVADARDVPFGIIYNARGAIDSNAGWLQFAAEMMATYEGAGGGTPDHVVFQSWTDQPDRVLPDDDVAAFTGLINRYFATRTLLRVPTAVSQKGVVVVDGVLGTMDGRPLAGELVGVEATPCRARRSA